MQHLNPRYSPEIGIYNTTPQGESSFSIDGPRKASLKPRDQRIASKSKKNSLTPSRSALSKMKNNDSIE